MKWNVDVRTHGIAVIIDKLLAEDWEGTEEGGVPGYYEEKDCVVSARQPPADPTSIHGL